jgi:hypothetical protein
MNPRGKKKPGGKRKPRTGASKPRAGKQRPAAAKGTFKAKPASRRDRKPRTGREEQVMSEHDEARTPEERAQEKKSPQKKAEAEAKDPSFEQQEKTASDEWEKAYQEYDKANKP